MRLQAKELEVALYAALEMPVWAATPRTLQCVEPLAGLVCSVVWIRWATRSSSMLRGAPGRTSSYSPAIRRSMNRVRHLPTVAWLSSRRAAIELLASPSALLRTMRARVLNDAGNDRLRANDLSCARSSSVTTNSAFGLPFFIAISPSTRAELLRRFRQPP
jgi:hypothetical protein